MMDAKFFFENHNEPLLINDFLDWEILQWDINRWNEALGDEDLLFRMGDMCGGEEPQWERTTDTLTGTFKDFVHFSESNENKWLYFDYKYLKNWFTNKEDIRKTINWKQFGFPERTAEDSTIWIGSKGAHTPCHADTYGFNLVAQVFGTKLWVLFPPEENLRQTRIPYEESSVYSRINFYSPSVADCKNVSNCRKVILQPGQVLFIPNGWWHYVENLETAVSVNTWVPIAKDVESRIEEAITLSMMKAFTNDTDEDIRKRLLNPNENLEHISVTDTVKLVTQHIQKRAEAVNDGRKKKAINSKQTTVQTEKTNSAIDATRSKQNTSMVKTNNFLNDNKNHITLVEKLSEVEFREFMRKQAERRSITTSSNDEECDLKRFLKVVTDPEVVGLIKRKLLEQVD